MYYVSMCNFTTHYTLLYTYTVCFIDESCHFSFQHFLSRSKNYKHNYYRTLSTKGRIIGLNNYLLVQKVFQKTSKYYI